MSTANKSFFVDPPLPLSGHRLDWPLLSGSQDALWLSRVAQIDEGHLLVVVTASTQDAQRLQAEILWFAPNLDARLLPDWETLPYDSFSPHPDLVSERLSTLWAVWQGKCRILLVPAPIALYRLPPPAFLAAYSFVFGRGEKLDAERFRAQVTLAGYQHVTQVALPGEYSIRGGIIDLFPMGSPLPYRIDLFDDEIETLRAFDVDTQRTLYPVEEIRLLPAREFPMNEAGRACFRRKFRETFEGDSAKAQVYKDISSGMATAGIEYYLPLFFEETATLFDYLSNPSFVLHGNVSGALADFWRETRARYAMLFSGDRTRPLLEPQALFLSEEDFFLAIKGCARIQIPPRPDAPVADIAIDRRAKDPLMALKRFMADFAGRVLLLAESPGRLETLAQMLAEHGLKPASATSLADFLAGADAFALGVSPLYSGLLLENRLAFLTEYELYADNAQNLRKTRAKKASLDNWLKDLTELKAGDPVVHECHGIGRYMGLAHMDLGEGTQEFLQIHYAGDARLFVPVSQLRVISRYSGADSEHAPLHVLGSGQWEKAKKKAARQARDAAAELLALYARRAARQGHAFSFSEHDYRAFAEGFGFEETPDQSAAIAAVLEDMQSGKPMDRLVCGDVGFGKTEVALRAAFCAVAGGKQVAVLCPTTLLCEQHYQTFANRFAGWPITVAEFSRFRTAKESAHVLGALAEGKIDIVIGTHKLIAQTVAFARLGLVVIDEEHRFGVRQKELLRALRANVDVLTLTATPIPRTLAMSLEGLRDFSVIATAPEKRLSIKTFVSRFSNGLIREAALRELKRGGQVYFLHNEVKTIETLREKLEKLLPEARIVVGHGQMNERELERVMRDFVARRANLLLCTTIVETGIDNPHANTIIINRAEKLGLAQLHQLRGRVGRSHHQAYAYLLTEDERGMKREARQRLEAIQSMEALGSGFYLAMHDLEIRGAGEVLGEHQSGEIQEIGFNLFAEMLERAVSALRAGKIPDEEELTRPARLATEINLRLPALLPDAYCPDVCERLSLYKRLSESGADEAIDALQEELIDRFGHLPPQGETLIAVHRLRLFLQPYGVRKLDADGDRVLVTFDPELARSAPIDPVRIVVLAQQDRNYRLAGPDRLAFSCHMPGLREKVAAVRTMFEQLTHT
ncbi:MAG: transcription-repair coupling factor [Zoogloeaceae bacterium]|nr:transcription-repair coupling factor [Zoogloeaceae bacterium]